MFKKEKLLFASVVCILGVMLFNSASACVFKMPAKEYLKYYDVVFFGIVKKELDDNKYLLDVQDLWKGETKPEYSVIITNPDAMYGFSSFKKFWTKLFHSRTALLAKGKFNQNHDLEITLFRCCVCDGSQIAFGNDIEKLRETSLIDFGKPVYQGAE